MALQLRQVEVRPAPRPIARPAEWNMYRPKSNRLRRPARRRRARAARPGASRAAAPAALPPVRSAGSSCRSARARSSARSRRSGSAAPRPCSTRSASSRPRSRHEHPRPRVQRVDHHLPVGRPRDLHPPIGEIRRRLRHPPRAVLAHTTRLLQEPRDLPRQQPFLTLRTRRQQLLPPAAERTLQRGDELERVTRQDLRIPFAAELDACREAAWHGR